MGSFSVSCGVTKLSITCGEECVFIPLITRKVYGSDVFKGGHRPPYATMQVGAMIVNNDELWEPAGFPIFGTYDDYGSIEDIVHDDNTAAIEKEFGMTIEEFVAMATEGRRNPYDTYSSFCEKYFSYPNDLDFDTPVEVLLEHLGFVNKANEKVVVETGKEEFKVFWREDGAKQKPWTYQNYDKNRFLSDYQERTGEYLGINDMEAFERMSSIGGMFVLKEVYEFYSKNYLTENEMALDEFSVNESFLKRNGFIKKETDDYSDIFVCGKVEYNATERTVNGNKSYSFEDFLKECKKLKKEIDLSPYNGFDMYDWKKLNFKESTIQRLLRMINLNLRFIREIEVDDNNIEEILEKSTYSEIRMAISSSDEMYNLKNFEMLTRIYAKELLSGRLIDEYFDFLRFSRAMYVTNTIWSPSFCGPQCGSRLAEIKLSYITKKIVDEREKLIKEECTDYKPLNPLSNFSRYE